MEFYVTDGSEQTGPFSIIKVGELLREKTITPDTLAWHREMDEWKPIREIPALESLVKSEENRVATPPPLPEASNLPGTPTKAPMQGAAAATATATPLNLVERLNETRPFSRFAARMFDFLMVLVIVTLFAQPEGLQPNPELPFSEQIASYLEAVRSPEAEAYFRALIVAVLGWQLIEAFLIHQFGMTPGKALFGIRVSKENGDRLSISRSLGRSFLAFILGAGFYQFPFILIGTAFSFFRLIANRKTLWDQHLASRVETTRMTPLRIVLAIGAFFALLMLQSLKTA